MCMCKGALWRADMLKACVTSPPAAGMILYILYTTCPEQQVGDALGSGHLNWI